MAGGAATISGAGVVSGVRAGTAVISYTLPSGCMTADTFTVYPSPPAITGATTVCLGATSAMSDTLSGGVWSTPGGVVTVDAGTGSVTGTSTGSATITYTTTGGCMAAKTVSVLPLPGVYGVTGGGSFCAGDTGVHVMLSGSANSAKYGLYDGGTIMGSLNGSGGFLDFGAETKAGVYTVIGTDTITGCSSMMADSATVIVSPLVLPSVSIASLPADTVCAGTSVSFTATPTNGGPTPMYQWKVRWR